MVCVGSIAGGCVSTTQLGGDVRRGQRSVKDREKAVKWYTEAAEQNLAESQYNLGMIYADGQDYREAFKWYAKAAEQGIRMRNVK